MHDKPRSNLVARFSETITVIGGGVMPNIAPVNSAKIRCHIRLPAKPANMNHGVMPNSVLHSHVSIVLQFDITPNNSMNAFKLQLTYSKIFVRVAVGSNSATILS